MREPSSPFANGSREAVGERTLCLHPRSSLCQAFCGVSPQGGIRQPRLGNSSRGEYRRPDRLVRGDPHGLTSADTSLGVHTPATPTSGNIPSPNCLRSFKTHCAERGRTTPSTHPPSAPRASFVLKLLLLSVPVPAEALRRVNRVGSTNNHSRRGTNVNTVGSSSRHIGGGWGSS